MQGIKARSFCFRRKNHVKNLVRKIPSNMNFLRGSNKHYPKVKLLANFLFA